jgi:hypothetical protein
MRYLEEGLRMALQLQRFTDDERTKQAKASWR